MTRWKVSKPEDLSPVPRVHCGRRELTLASHPLPHVMPGVSSLIDTQYTQVQQINEKVITLLVKQRRKDQDVRNFELTNPMAV